jgi:histidinol-phosphatase (PHP family)
MHGLVDCHVHSARCGHGIGTVAEYVECALARGLSGIAMTEHLPLPDDLDPVREYSMPACDLAEYVREVAAASSDGLRVAVGIEADWLPSRMDHVRGLLSSHDWDVVLGSVHFLDAWAFDDPNLVSQWDARDIDATWESYFDRLIDAACSGLFDVMAHPDLVKKFGHRPARDPELLYDEAASAFAEAGVAAEVSTAGLRKPVGELYPGHAFLAALKRHDVPVTIGSDAHAPDEVGYCFDEARTAIRAAGYDRVAWFEGRTMREVVL